MARGAKKWTEALIRKYQAEGRGKGEGETWIPWVRILDFHSEGRTDFGWSAKLGRAPDLLSDGESMLFSILEYRDDVIDIREGYPLNTDDTLEVASMLGVRHQYYPGTKLPLIMTLDFMVTTRVDGKTSAEAWAVKVKDDLDKPGVIESLEVSRYICEAMGIPFFLGIKENMPKQACKNLESFRKAMPKPGGIDFDEKYFEEFELAMEANLRTRKYDGVLEDYCKEFDKSLSAQPGTAMRVVRILLHKKRLRMDLNNENYQLAHMSSFRLVEPATQPHLVRVSA